MLAMVLTLLAAASDPAASAPLYRGEIVDRGTLVRADQVVWPPKDRHDRIVNGWIYQVRHADGSVRTLAQMNGRYYPEGTEVVVTFGDELRLESARTYKEPARPAPEVLARMAAHAPAGPNTVDELLVQGRREQPPIAELASRATGKDWNNVYCQTETRLGSRMPAQRCISLRTWDMEHECARGILGGPGGGVGLMSYCGS